MHTVTNIDGLLELMKTLQGEASQKEFAQYLGVSPQYLNDVYNHRREPGQKMTQPLGIRAATSYSVPDNLTTSTASITRGGIHGSSQESTKEDTGHKKGFKGYKRHKR